MFSDTQKRNVSQDKTGPSNFGIISFYKNTKDDELVKSPISDLVIQLEKIIVTP